MTFKIIVKINSKKTTIFTMKFRLVSHKILKLPNNYKKLKNGTKTAQCTKITKDNTGAKID